MTGRDLSPHSPVSVLRRSGVSIFESKIINRSCRSRIYTTINFTDEFRNLSVTLRVSDANVSVVEVGVAGWAWWA